jgi:hypothetical protein
VAFQQLYYTSCENGLGGYGGFQFNAVTPGVSPAVLREVEERTIYQPPRWLAGENADEPEAYPVAFSYTVNGSTGAAITAHVVPTGTDYSGRPGNYFAHALASSTPERDFGDLLPAELWGSPLWQRAPAFGTELPALIPPLPPGVIDRPGAQAFLEARAADGILPELLHAVGRAMAGERPVLLVTQDATETAWWIAAVSYLLGERLARRMTFTTYSHRPGYARYHLTGTLPETLPPEAGASFQVFDLAAGRTPRDPIPALAVTLASTGVMGAAGLWQQATAFASGTEASLDDWDAPVTVAAGLLDRPLTPGQADTVARWLVGAAGPVGAVGRMPPGLADVTLGLLLGQPGAALGDERLRDLLDLARRLPAPARAEQLEGLLAVRAIARISSGEPAEPVVFASPAATTARNLALQFLGGAAPGQAAALLDWTAASGIDLPADSLQRYGRTRLAPDIPAAELAAVVRRHPAIRRGLLERLAAEPPEVTRAVLGGPVGTQLDRADLAGHPELTELWLLQSAAGGRVAPMRAFDEIADIRGAAGRSARVDATLLRLLWPRGCPPDDLTELLGLFTDPPAADVIGWFAPQLASVSARATAGDPWLRLAEALSGHPVLGLLPEQESRRAQAAVRVLPLLRRARDGGPRGEAGAFAGLYREYPAADDGTRGLLARELPAMLARARPLGQALRGCPHALTAAFCLALRDWLDPAGGDVALARQVFAAGHDPTLADRPALGEQLMTVFEQVRQWSRRDLSVLAQSLADDPALAQSFQRWRKTSRGERPRWLPGGAGPSAPGT